MIEGCTQEIAKLLISKLFKMTHFLHVISPPNPERGSDFGQIVSVYRMSTCNDVVQISKS